MSTPTSDTAEPRSSRGRMRREELTVQLERLLLTEGFLDVTIDDMARRLRCSKATLYTIAPSKESLVLMVVKRFFRESANRIELAVEAEPDPLLRISRYLEGVGSAMRRTSPAFYRDLLAFAPAAEIYRRNSRAAASRVQVLIDDGVEAAAFRAVNGRFVGHVAALAIDAIQSGELLSSAALDSGEAFTQLGDLLVKGLAAR